VSEFEPLDYEELPTTPREEREKMASSIPT
jgi:hypothetical protein